MLWHTPGGVGKRSTTEHIFQTQRTQLSTKAQQKERWQATVRSDNGGCVYDKPPTIVSAQRFGVPCSKQSTYQVIEIVECT